ncbi:Abi family protein [Kistimonas asteriae]|uniref:Abi family protein n=1 Tax=Kistimonas asteriae TaxID=517724 RepID=UPI001BAA001A|nr:Abi family protein [Kistimonas asteriae]
MAYNRPWKSYEEQLDILKARGLQVSNDEAAIAYLQRIGYYRLSAYWYPFRIFYHEQDPLTGRLSTKRTDNFVENTHFVDAVELYIFDKKLRLLMLDALERVEIALRVNIAYVLGEKDVFAYKHIGLFHPSFAGKTNKRTGKTRHQEWLDKYEGLLRRSKEDFVKHYRQKHGDDLPMWVAIELLDFGAMSQLYSMMRVPDQEQIARRYDVADFKVFSSWLRALNYLRNLCAHHSRLWNRNVIDQPRLPAAGVVDWCDAFIGQHELIAKPFLLFNIVGHLLYRICPATGWHDRLKSHIKSFPRIQSDRQVSMQDIGLPEEWERLLER